jgi:hypothetical protein
MARVLACLCLLFCAITAPGAARSQEHRAQSPRAAQSAPVVVSGATRVEAEQLVSGAAASAGRVSVQRMAGFGGSWSGGAQLLWAPPAPDPRSPPTLTAAFPAPAAGTYSIQLRYTQAPDYGLVQVHIGRKQVAELNGHAPSVQLAQATLANVSLASGPNALVLRVVGKAPQSTGYLVGIDAIELLPVSATASPSATGGVQQQTPVPIVGPSAKLTFAALDAKMSWAALGALERDLYDSELASPPFAWESAFAKSFEWRWQVATQPFPPHAALSAPGLIAQGPAPKTPFKIDFSHNPPFGKPPAGLQSTQGGSQPAGARATRRPQAMDLYIRLVPLQNGSPAGPPSNTIVAHYKRGKSPMEKLVGQSFQKQAELDAMKQSMLGYSLSIVSFQPAKWPKRPGCIVVVENPYAGKPPHPLWSYQVGHEYCPKKDPQFMEKDAIWWIGQAFKGWLFAWEGAASFYGQAKTWVAQQVAKHLVPCELLGDDIETTCEAAFEVVVDSALTAAMASQGIPPTLPSLSGMEAAAKGDLLDAAVDFTCDQIQGKGGECDPLLKQQLRNAYEAGLEQLEEQGKRAGQEPDCQSADFKDAHMIPLPCFTDYPGTRVEPAPGAVYEPPLIEVKVTRTKPTPVPYAPCTIRTTLPAKNHFSGHSYVNGQKLPAKDIAGELYVPATANIPLLAPGQSATLTLAFSRYQPFSIASNASTPGGTLVEWSMLYWGAEGTLVLTSDGPLPKDLGGVRTACSPQATKALTLPAKP